MSKPIYPDVITPNELKERLTNQIIGLYDQIDNPLSISSELSATFKLALLNGTLKYIESLGTAGLMGYMRDFKYAQIEVSLTKMAKQTAREKERAE